ncbi:hypothetical protein C8F01DRAFT_34546 [Mycena amicta]|nr:hypothetical protein C8F01DRAFT_34546 [Mycena amicta]
MRCAFADFAHALRPFPEYHHYIVFSLDPVATLEDLDDPEATLVASQLEAKKYVALVAHTKETLSRRYIARRLYLLAPHQPLDIPEKFQESIMCVAVEPCAQPHPLGRPAIVPTLPLPWSTACYHSTFDSLDVRFPYAQASGPGGWRYAPDEQIIYEQMFDADRERVADARKAADSGLSLTPAEPLEFEDWPERDEYADIKPISSQDVFYRSDFPGDPKTEEERMFERRYGERSACSSGDMCPLFCGEEAADSESNGFDPDYDDLDCLDSWSVAQGQDCFKGALDYYAAAYKPFDATLPVVRASYDLDEVEEVNDPEDFFKELQILNDLRESSTARKAKEKSGSTKVQGNVEPAASQSKWRLAWKAAMRKVSKRTAAVGRSLRGVFH